MATELRKKVLIITNVTYDLYKMRKEIVQAIREKGYDVYITAILDKNTDDFFCMGCEMISSKIDRRGKHPVKELSLLIQYFALINKIKPDLVLTYTIKPNLYGGILCSLFRIPFIVNITGLGSAIGNGGVVRMISVFLYKWGLKRCSCVFVQNTDIKKFLINNNVKPRKYRLIPGSGVNLSEHCYEEYPTDNGQITFLYIGRVMKEKGIDELIKAAELVKQEYPNVEFKILGALEEDYRDIFIKKQNENTIDYNGRQDDVHSHIKNCHAVILPSHHEGMSNVLLEAASTGRPVIASKISGCIETFEEGVSGFGFEVKNPYDFAKKLLHFIELPYETKKHMGLEGRRIVEKRFNRDLVIKAYLEEIERII